MFQGCSFQTNVSGTFKSHSNRKHTRYSLQDFKEGIVTRAAEDLADGGTDNSADSVEFNVDCDNDTEPETKEQDLFKIIDLKLGS